MAHAKFASSSFKFLAQGAIIQEFEVAGHNLVLSFPNPEQYLNGLHYGETIGRVANRISQAVIKNLNGRTYQLTANLNGQHHLHGGTVCWGHRTFSGPNHISRNGRDVIQFTYLSPDNEEGYPGTVELRVWYFAKEEEGVAILEMEYEAELVGNECEETVVNVTNHSYFNLGTSQTVDGTEFTLATNEFLVIDETQIPTGEISSFQGIEANEPFILSASHPAIDHCFVMDKDVDNVPLDTRHRELRKVVSAHNKSTGITLEVSTTEPSFQFCTSDFISRVGFCVEPCRFINAINMPEWRNQVVLRRGQLWGSRIVYQAWKA